jgi:hypothetical protein
VHSVYVPPEQSEAIYSAHNAWRQSQDLSAEISADTREQLLHLLEHEKQLSRSERTARSSRKT